MKKNLSSSVIFILITASIFSQNKDSIITHSLKQITVFGNKYNISSSEFPVEKDNLNSILELGGFNLVRKGVFLAQDIYADGLKRGDYSISIDGERSHNACPMRMDAPITRINPLEIESVELIKSSSNLQSGLGGLIAIRRSIPKENLNLLGSITKVTGSSNEMDVSFLAEKFDNRISFKYSTGLPYKTGDGKSFKDLYGYKNNSKYLFGEVSFFGVMDNWKYSGSFMYSDNVLFPYLQMDERKSAVYNASLSYQDYKIYFSYTDHLMDNNLRVNTMFMETDAKNLTAGIKSKYFEAYYRNWNGDNKIVSSINSMSIYNNILPKINLYSANIFDQFELGNFSLTAKAGISYYHLGNKDIISFYKNIYNNAPEKRIFPTAGLSISHSLLLSDAISFSSMLDVATEAPEAEALFVAVKRMMGKPIWSGNPNLNQPVRSTLRSNFTFSNFSTDLFASYIYNYVYLASTTVGMQKYQTFGNINSILAGLTLRVKFEFIESELSYTFGENTTSGQPLTEILPLHISTRILLPEFCNIKLYVKHTYENAQNRIDRTFLENPSSAWNRIDVGLSAKYDLFILSVDLENILNANYSRHLSYVRDPFASGFKVLEPGISVRANLRYYYN